MIAQAPSERIMTQKKPASELAFLHLRELMSDVLSLCFEVTLTLNAAKRERRDFTALGRNRLITVDTNFRAALGNTGAGLSLMECNRQASVHELVGNICGIGHKNLLHVLK
jgi:hypothetical protein